MCGRANLPLNYIMGKNIIVYFASDIENGGCKAIVKCDEISAELSGTFSEDVSLTAEALLSLAMPKYKQREFISAEEAQPVYIRNKVALTMAEQKQR